jgi:hypothetical protein
MDIVKTVDALREERRVVGGSDYCDGTAGARAGKRRGRPPAWMSTMRNAGSRRGRPPGSKNKAKVHAAV